MKKTHILAAGLTLGVMGALIGVRFAGSAPANLGVSSAGARPAPGTSTDDAWESDTTNIRSRLEPRLSPESAPSELTAHPRSNPEPAPPPTAQGDNEDEAIAAMDNHPRQRVWRGIFNRERPDDEWTLQISQELRQQAAAILEDRAMSVWDLSCRESICRMYVKFDDQLDAEAFRAAFSHPGNEYEFQSLDPDFKGVGFDRSEHTYEVMIQRPLPEAAVQNGNAQTEDSHESGNDSVVGVAVAGRLEPEVLTGNVN